MSASLRMETASGKRHGSSKRASCAANGVGTPAGGETCTTRSRCFTSSGGIVSPTNPTTQPTPRRRHPAAARQAASRWYGDASVAMIAWSSVTCGRPLPRSYDLTHPRDEVRRRESLGARGEVCSKRLLPGRVAQRRDDPLHRLVERGEEQAVVVADDLDRAAGARHEDDAAGTHHLRPRDAEVLPRPGVDAEALAREARRQLRA